MSNGKGDKPRPVDRTRYGENYDRIFGMRCPICRVNYKGVHPDNGCQESENNNLKKG